MSAMKRIYILAAWIAALTTLAACERSGMEEARNLIRIASIDMSNTTDDASTRAGEGNRALQPMYLFWTDGNFNTVTTQETVDFFVRTPEGDEIDTYKTNPFGTGYYYPFQNKPIYAAGFAPAPGDGYLSFVTTGDYSKFSIPENTAITARRPDDAYGVMDIYSAPMISATDASPFTVANPLQFYHAQTTIYFQAKLADSMTKYVKEVKVHIPGSLTPYTLEWDTSAERYVVKGDDEAAGFIFGNYWTEDGEWLVPKVSGQESRRNEPMFYQLTKETIMKMGYTYIVPPGNHMSFEVVFKMSDTGNDFNEEENGARTVTLPVDVTFDNSISLGPGDAYTLLLSIDAYDIELIGKKCNWDNGGSINVPIQIKY